MTTSTTTTFLPGDAVLTGRIKRYCRQHNLYFKEHGHWQRYGRRGRHYKVDRYVADAQVVSREQVRRDGEIIQQHAQQWQDNIFRELDKLLAAKPDRSDYIDWREFGF